jgi:YD repeat-containing protein
MVAVVTGGGLGLNLGSGSVLGGAGVGGAASFGRQSDRVYVNAASGNLVVQGRDELLVGRGPDAAGLRTYNSLGAFTDDNGDNWQPGLVRKVWLNSGTVNTPGSVVYRRDEDGSEAAFFWDSGLNKYVGYQGGGSADSLSYDGTNWTFVDGTSRTVEVYAGSTGRLLSQTDASGNTLSFSYNGAGLLASVTTPSGEVTYYDYSGTQLTQLRTVSKSSEGAGLDRTLTRVRYGYDTSNRLQSVTVDLSPEDNSIVDGRVFTTTYTYDGTSKRIASITQSDGAKLSFAYYGDGRIQNATDALGGVTTFAYDSANRATTVTDPLGQASVYRQRPAAVGERPGRGWRGGHHQLPIRQHRQRHAHHRCRGARCGHGLRRPGQRHPSDGCGGQCRAAQLQRAKPAADRNHRYGGRARQHRAGHALRLRQHRHAAEIHDQRRGAGQRVPLRQPGPTYQFHPIRQRRLWHQWLGLDERAWRRRHGGLGQLSGSQQDPARGLRLRLARPAHA